MNARIVCRYVRAVCLSIACVSIPLPCTAQETDIIDGSAVKATVSAGLAVHGAGAQAVAFEELLDRSDRALYVAKANGRNRIQLAPEERTGVAMVKYA